MPSQLRWVLLKWAVAFDIKHISLVSVICRLTLINKDTRHNAFYAQTFTQRKRFAYRFMKFKWTNSRILWIFMDIFWLRLFLECLWISMNEREKKICFFHKLTTDCNLFCRRITSVVSLSVILMCNVHGKTKLCFYGFPNGVGDNFLIPRMHLFCCFVFLRRSSQSMKLLKFWKVYK